MLLILGHHTISVEHSLGGSFRVNCTFFNPNRPRALSRLPMKKLVVSDYLLYGTNAHNYFAHTCICKKHFKHSKMQLM